MRAILLSAVLLASCTHLTPEQHAQLVIERFGPYCLALGYEAATEGWRNCIMSSYWADRQARIAAFGAIQSARPRSCTTMGSTTTCY